MTGELPARRRGRRAPRPAGSCRQCLAWGYHGGQCRACENYTAVHPSGHCRTCHRTVPVNDGVCRLCRKQAALIAGPANKTRVDLTVAARTGHQLFLADLERAVRIAGRHTRARPNPYPVGSPRAVLRATPAPWRQPALFHAQPDLRRISSLDPPHDPRLAAALGPYRDTRHRSGDSMRSHCRRPTDQRQGIDRASCVAGQTAAAGTRLQTLKPQSETHSCFCLIGWSSGPGVSGCARWRRRVR